MEKETKCLRINKLNKIYNQSIFSLTETLISRHGDRHVDLDSDEGEGEFQIELQNQQNGRFSEPDTPAPTSSQKTNCFVFMASVMASLGGILFGYDIGKYIAVPL